MIVTTTVSRNKDKGTRAEKATVEALRRLLCYDEEQVDRDRLRGTDDRGDVRGIKGIVIEVKGAEQRNWQPWAWLVEAELERRRADADFGILVIKPPGVGLPRGEKFLTVMYEPDARRLHEKAGQPRIRLVDQRRVGINAGLSELIERERHVGDVPVEVRVRQGGGETWMSLMRLDARCKLLVDAGYSGCEMITPVVSGDDKEFDDG